MSELIETITEMKAYCAEFHWKLYRVTEDGSQEHLFAVGIPGPMGVVLRLNIESENPSGASVEELNRLLYALRKSMDSNFNTLTCDECRVGKPCRPSHDRDLFLYIGQEPDFDAINNQMDIDRRSSGIEEFVQKW